MSSRRASGESCAIAASRRRRSSLSKAARSTSSGRRKSVPGRARPLRAPLGRCQDIGPSPARRDCVAATPRQSRARLLPEAPGASRNRSALAGLRNASGRERPSTCVTCSLSASRHRDQRLLTALGRCPECSRKRRVTDPKPAAKAVAGPSPSAPLADLGRLIPKSESTVRRLRRRPLVARGVGRCRSESAVRFSCGRVGYLKLVYPQPFLAGIAASRIAPEPRWKRFASASTPAAPLPIS